MEDWKKRQHALEELQQHMIDPSPELMSRVESQLPTFLSDENPTVQKAALSLCEKYLKTKPTEEYSIDYTKFGSILITHCLDSRQPNIDIATNLILQCFRQGNHESLYNSLFDGLLEKPAKTILAVISIIIGQLATLTTKDEEEALEITERLKPLLESHDPKIRKDAAAAIASAKIVLGQDLENTNPTDTHGASTENNASAEMTEFSVTDDSWITDLQSQNWKDRKNGYTKLFKLLNPNFSLQQIEHDFLISASTEKHIACMELVSQIIEKLAIIFKTQLSRKTREYIRPIINMMKEKRQSRLSNLRCAFDAVASNVVSSPYESPFVDNLLQMMKSKTIQLREEALEFINRYEGSHLTPIVLEAVKELQSDPAVSVRELAATALDHYQNPNSNQNQNQNQNEPSSIQNQSSFLRKKNSPENPMRKSYKRKTGVQNPLIAWDDWVNPETKTNLTAGQWTSVTHGLDQLKHQFAEDPSQPSAVVAGLSSLFTGKTFTPRVTNILMEQILFYMNADPEKLSDEALIHAVNFGIDKIQDKNFEASVFAILDKAAEINSTQFVFQLLYPHLSAKNPALPARITHYFAHHLSTYQSAAGIHIEDFSNEIRPLFTHSNQNVRKGANDCLKAIIGFIGDAALEYFKYVKNIPSQSSPNSQNSKRDESNALNSKKSLDQDKNEEKNDKNEKNEKKIPEMPSKIIKLREPRGKSEIPIPSGRKPIPSPRGQSRKERRSDENEVEKDLIPQHIIQGISKTHSVLECKKSLDEAEAILKKLLEVKGASSCSATQFSEMFNKLRYWFKDATSGIILSATRVIALSFKLMGASEIESISKELFSDLFLLLNLFDKANRQAAISALNELAPMYPQLVSEVFLPTYPKLNSEGKRCAIIFIRDISFDMIVSEFTPFIVSVLAEKSDDIRDAAKPLIIRYFALESSGEEARKAALDFPPAKKSTVLQRIETFSPSPPPNQNEKINKAEKISKNDKIDKVNKVDKNDKNNDKNIDKNDKNEKNIDKNDKINDKNDKNDNNDKIIEKGNKNENNDKINEKGNKNDNENKRDFRFKSRKSIKNPIFKSFPTLSEKETRIQTIDPFIALKVLNNEIGPKVLINLRQELLEQYFNSSILGKSSNSNDNELETIKTLTKTFLDLVTNDFDHLTLIVDVIFIWWSEKALLTKFSNAYSFLLSFITSFLAKLNQKDRKLSQFEFTIILPPLLEISGKNDRSCEKIIELLFKICNGSELLDVLHQFLSIAASICMISATFQMIMELLPQPGYEALIPDFRQNADRIFSLIAEEPKSNEKLYNTIIQFKEFLNEIEKPDRSLLDRSHTLNESYGESISDDFVQTNPLEEEDLALAPPKVVKTRTKRFKRKLNENQSPRQHINPNNINNHDDDTNNDSYDIDSNNNLNDSNNNSKLSEKDNNSQIIENEKDNNQINNSNNSKINNNENDNDNQMINNSQIKNENDENNNDNENNENDANNILDEVLGDEINVNNSNVSEDQIQNEKIIPKIEKEEKSRCEFNENIQHSLQSGFLEAYYRILDISSDDIEKATAALKKCSNEMKTNSNMYLPHLDTLALLLIQKTHQYFEMEPIPQRALKYVTFTLLSIFNETNMGNLIRKEYIQQIMYELLTGLTNGISYDVITKIIYVLIQNIFQKSPLFSFIALLSALNEYSLQNHLDHSPQNRRKLKQGSFNSEENSYFSMKWFELTLKLFETCATHICALSREPSNQIDVTNTLLLVDKFFETSPPEQLNKTTLGQKIYKAITDYVKRILKSLESSSLSKDFLKHFGSNSTVLKFISASSPRIQIRSKISSPSSMPPLKPLHN